MKEPMRVIDKLILCAMLLIIQNMLEVSTQVEPQGRLLWGAAFLVLPYKINPI